MHALDYTVLASYILLTLAIGAFFARRQKQYRDYFLAGRSMHWFPIGISIMVTAFSAINYTAFSGEVSSHGLYVMLCLPVFFFVALPITRIIIPFYYQMGLGSAYEYLERRFDVRVRCLASGLFILWRLLWMAMLIFVPCKVLALITGLEAYVLILLAGSTATIYTLLGGMKAVMWTDVLQFFVLLGGVLIGVTTTAAQTPGGLAGMLHLGLADGLGKPFQPFDPQIFSFDPHIRITLWSCWLGTLVAFLSRYGADQVVVQRYFTAGSLRHALKGFHLSYLSAVVALLALGLLGFAIHAHAAGTDLPVKGSAPPILFFADFVSSLPRGGTGLLVAGLFAAAMSSLDSGINSCSAVAITDFYRRWGGGVENARELFYGRLATLAFGAVATGAALQIGRLGSIFEIANRIINGLGSPLLALFFLGMFSRRANSRGTLAGGLLGAVCSTYVSFAVQDLALHYYAVLNLGITLLLGYAFSLIENLLASEPLPRQLAWVWKSHQRERVAAHRMEPPR